MLDATRLKYNEISLGDVTFDGAMGLAFIFWNGSRTRAKAGQNAKWHINIKGMETVLSREEIGTVLLGRVEPWTLKAEPARTRLYEIACQTDGIMPRDLAMAASLYRTAQMDQLGVKRENVSYRLERVLPLTPSDMYKSMYAMKAEDETSNCIGKIDKYSPCGGVEHAKMIPFILLSLTLIFAWVLAAILWKNVPVDVPHNAATWRKAAFIQLDAMKVVMGNTRKISRSQNRSPIFDIEAGNAFCEIPEANVLVTSEEGIVILIKTEAKEESSKLEIQSEASTPGIIESSSLSIMTAIVEAEHRNTKQPSGHKDPDSFA